jgi:phosphatidylserine/phosphatidylglycerophosphate/cardiolipin synthase-like enzyme
MNDLVSLLLSPSDFADLHGRCRTTRAAIEELIVEAAKSILVTAYTFDDPRISTLLATRAEEGVRVEVYLDKDQFLNDKYSRDARQSVHDRLIDAGARVHLLDTQPDATFHVKALIADNRKAVIGSANITTRGLDRNTEVGLLLEGPTVAHLATAVNLNLRQLQNGRGGA